MKIFFIGIGALVLLALGAMIFLPRGAAPAPSDPDIVAVSGLHWHPQIEIYVRGEKIEIPQNIGIGAVHRPIHTHDDLPLIHLEFNGIVRRENLMLGGFFESWGKGMRSFGENMRMTVNGKENTEYERYVMRDGDKIVLQFD